MSRRFITVEDVRRAEGRELLVDEDTVVTPQALEAAQQIGLLIRCASGALYHEPAPDRGPDAKALHGALPEPAEGESEVGPTGFVVTAVGRNRPGILAEVTGTLGQFQASVENISQRMVDDYFHLLLTVRMPDGAAFGELKRSLQCLGGEDDYVVRVMHERVFRFMHRI